MPGGFSCFWWCGFLKKSRKGRKKTAKGGKNPSVGVEDRQEQCFLCPCEVTLQLRDRAQLDDEGWGWVRLRVNVRIRVKVRARVTVKVRVKVRTGVKVRIRIRSGEDAECISLPFQMQFQLHFLGAVTAFVAPLGVLGLQRYLLGPGGEQSTSMPWSG